MVSIGKPLTKSVRTCKNQELSFCNRVRIDTRWSQKIVVKISRYKKRMRWSGDTRKNGLQANWYGGSVHPSGMEPVWYGGSVQPVGTLGSTLQVSTTHQLCLLPAHKREGHCKQLAGWDFWLLCLVQVNYTLAVVPGTKQQSRRSSRIVIFKSSKKKFHCAVFYI